MGIRASFFGRVSFVLVASALWTASSAADNVSGNLIQFGENGAWSWYQDERAIMDAANGRLVVGYVANVRGVGGSPRDGDVTAVIFDLAAMRGQSTVLRDALVSYGGGDDHNTAAFLIRPDGRYLAVYAGHNNNNLSYYRVWNNGWGAERTFDWNTMPGGTDFQTTYSNLFYLSAESRVYNFARTNARSPNLMVSANQGDTWSYGGQLTAPDTSIGYVNGYFKYSSNGMDRIDFIATEHHPRDFNTSIYHGFMRGGRSYNSAGTQVDANVNDQSAPFPDQFTRVFAANTVVQGATMTRCWTIDLQYYSANNIAAFFKCRAGNVDTDHRFFYARHNGSQWITTYLGRAGAKLFSSEEDYTGLGALNPNNAGELYLSSTFHPGTGASVGMHEIFRGTTTDNGATWAWTQITRNSTRPNIRPIIPSWDANNTAVLWFRGTMTNSHAYDEAVVGILRRGGESASPMTYVDAEASNTTLSTGGVLAATGPGTGTGAADNQWHWRSGFGNGGSLLASAESGGEDAPALRTRNTVAQAGTYDVWANFWGDPSADWRVRAGLAANATQVFRSMANKQPEAAEFAAAPVLTGANNTFMYQAYLGRVTLTAGSNLDVYVDDEAIQTGTASTLIGNTARTWYDGISFAQVNGVVGIKPMVRKARGLDHLPGYRDLRGRMVPSYSSRPKIKIPIP